MDSFARKLSISLLVTVLLIGTFFSTLFLFDVTDSKPTEGVVKGASIVVSHRDIEQSADKAAADFVMSIEENGQTSPAEIYDWVLDDVDFENPVDYLDPISLSYTIRNESADPQQVEYDIRLGWDGGLPEVILYVAPEEALQPGEQQTYTHQLANLLSVGTHSVKLELKINGSDNDLSNNLYTDDIVVSDNGTSSNSLWGFDSDGQSVSDTGTAGLEGVLGSSNIVDNNDPVWGNASGQCVKGGCLKFDGIDDYVDLGLDNYIHSNNGSFSVLMWAKGEGYQDPYRHSRGALFGWMGFSGERGVSFGPNDQGDFNFWVPIDEYSLTTLKLDDVHAPENWNHWAVVYDAQGQTMKLFKNAQLIGDLDPSDGVPSNIFTGNNISVKIGDRGDGLVNFKGYIDEVHYYAQAVSETNINEIYESEWGTGMPDLILTDVSISNPESLAPESYLLDARVCNEGGRAVFFEEGANVMKFNLNDEFIKYDKAASDFSILPGNCIESWSVPVSADYVKNGENTLNVMVDPDYLIREADEIDNSLTKTITLNSSMQPFHLTFNGTYLGDEQNRLPVKKNTDGLQFYADAGIDRDAVKFTKSSTYVEYACQDVFDKDNGTIMAWINFSEFSTSDQAIWHSDDSRYVLYYDYSTQNTNRRRLKVRVGSEQNAEISYVLQEGDGEIKWNTDEWHHVAVSWQLLPTESITPTYAVNMYVDGKLAGSKSFNAGANCSTFRVGNNYWPGMNWETGLIDEIWVYPQTRTAAQINEYYEKTKPTDEDDHGKLYLRLGSSDPSTKLLMAGTVDETLGNFTLLAENEPIEVSEITVTNLRYEGQKSLSELVNKMSLYFGSTLLGEVVPVEDSARFVFTGAPVLIDNNAANWGFTIKAEMAGIGVGYSGESGGTIHLQILGGNINAIGQETGIVLGGDDIDGKYTGNYHYLFKSQLIFAKENLTSSTLYNGSGVPLYKFMLISDPHGDAAIYKTTFLVTIEDPDNTLELSNFELFENPGTPSELNLTNSGALECVFVPNQTDKCVVEVLIDTGNDGTTSGGEMRVIPAGGVSHYELRANVFGSSSSAYVGVTIVGDPDLAVPYPSALSAVEADAGVYDNFIWSDLNMGYNSSSATSTREWFSGHWLSGFPAGQLDNGQQGETDPDDDSDQEEVDEDRDYGEDPGDSDHGRSEEEQKLRQRIKQLKRKVSELEKEVTEREKKLVKKVNKELTEKVKGKILLQVESDGEAWYVDETTGERFYLADGQSAFEALQAFGLGITNNNLELIPIGVDSRADKVDTDGDGLDDKLEEAIGTDINNPDTDGDGFSDKEEVDNDYSPAGSNKLQVNPALAKKLEGKILLQVESNGQAWYVHNGRRYYMRDGQLAYQIMRFLSLGISNDDLRQIQVGEFE